MYDSLGNYLVCSRCVHHALRVSYHRLSRQRSIKRRKNSEPIRSMTKAKVEEERLGKCVIMPQSCELSFMAWWKQLASTAIVNIQYLHHHHGNSVKPSDSAKKDAKSDFLMFVDANSQPYERSANSTSVTHFFGEILNYSNSQKRRIQLRWKSSAVFGWSV